MAQNRCLVCGNLLSEEANFCRKCGTRTLPSPAANPPVDPLDTKETNIPAAFLEAPPPPPPPPDPSGMRVTKLIETPTATPPAKPDNRAATGFVASSRPTTPIGKDTDAMLQQGRTMAPRRPDDVPAAAPIPVTPITQREKLVAPAPEAASLAGSQPPTARIEIPLEKVVEVPDTAEITPPARGRRWLLRVLGVGLLTLAGWAWFSSRRPAVPPALVTETPAVSTPTVEAESQPSATIAAVVAPSPEATSYPVEATPVPVDEATPAPSPKPTKRAAKPSPSLAPAPARKPSPSLKPAVKASPAPPTRPQARNQTVAVIERIKHGNDHLAAGQYANALREYEQARRLDPGNKDVHYLLGQTYQRMGNTEKALQAYRQCTSGVYAGVAQKQVKNLEKKLRKAQTPR